MQLFSRGHHSKMHFTQHLFLQQVFSKTVVKNFPKAIFFKYIKVIIYYNRANVYGYNKEKKTLLLTGRKKIKIKLAMQLFSRGHHSKMHFTQYLFLQQFFSKTVVKNFPKAIFFQVSIFS